MDLRGENVLTDINKPQRSCPRLSGVEGWARTVRGIPATGILVTRRPRAPSLFRLDRSHAPLSEPPYAPQSRSPHTDIKAGICTALPRNSVRVISRSEQTLLFSTCFSLLLVYVASVTKHRHRSKEAPCHVISNPIRSPLKIHLQQSYCRWPTRNVAEHAQASLHFPSRPRCETWSITPEEKLAIFL